MLRPWRTPAILAAGWLAIGVAAGTLEGLATLGARPFRPGWAPVLMGAVWASAVPLAVALARRLPPRRDAGPRVWIPHAAAALGASYVLNGVHHALLAAAGVLPAVAVLPAALRAGTLWLHLNAAGWAATVAAARWLDRPASDRDDEPVLQVARGRGVLRVPLREIEWIEADGDYVRVHTRGGRHLVSKRMKSLEEELPGTDFVRVHRSAIVNVARVREVRHRSHGDFEAVLADGTVVRVSRGRRDALLERIRGGEGREG